MGKRGPQPYAASKKDRARVRLYMAGGIAEPVIAHKLGICQNTLRRHFADELVFGRDVKRAENLDRLDAAADDGNVTAMKHLDAKFAAVSAAASFEALPGQIRQEPRLGKKEEAQIEAGTAGADTDWGGDLQTPPSRPN